MIGITMKNSGENFGNQYMGDEDANEKFISLLMTKIC